MKKRLWIIAAALLFTGTAAFYMLACAYLPDKIKEILVTQARETLGRRLSFDDVIYDPLKGLSVTNLTLYQKGDDRSPLLHVRKVHFNVLLAPLLLNKQAVIPSITITEPYVFLIREGETTWNFSDLLARRKPAAGKPKISVSVGGINIEKGRIEIADKTRPGAPVRILADTDLRASVSLTKDIRFSIAARPSEKSSLKADGIYALSRRELTADIDAQDLDAFSWLGLFPPSPIFTPRGGTVQMASLRVQHKGQKLRITGNLIFPQADMTFCPRGADQPCHTVRGDASATGIDFVRDGAAYFRFEGNTKVGRADLLFDNRTLIQGDLSAPALEVTRQNGKLKITGSAEGKGMHVEVSREHRIDGDAQLTGLTFIKNGLDFHLKAKAVIKKGRYAGSGKNLSADLASQALEVTRKDGKTAVEGDLTAANAALTVGDDTWTLTGQLSSPRLYFVQDNGSFYVKGGAELTDGDLTVGKQVKAKGRLKADSAEVLFKDGGLNVRAGGLLFENGSVITPDKNIAGTFSSKDSVLGLK
ncbi:MAG: AsmA family protein, partial [Candidatus Omnitrophota bacterium]|nr:AsmA family protein [Candidatus Omnitrophota bacterium]